MEYKIPQPDPKIFETDRTAAQKVVQENTVCYLVERIEYDEGIKVYYYGCPHPKKGYPTPEATVAVNLCKRLFLQAIKVSYKSLPLFLRPYRAFQSLIEAYCDVCWPHINHHFLKTEYLSLFSYQVLFIFQELTGNELLAKIAAHIVEYDVAYRYRFQDIMAEFDLELFDINPRKELKRLLKLFLDREKHEKIRDNAKILYRIVSLVLYIPGLMKKIFYVADLTDYFDFTIDEDDLYWMASRPDYDFGGKSLEERMKGIVMPQAFNIVI